MADDTPIRNPSNFVEMRTPTLEQEMFNALNTYVPPTSWEGYKAAAQSGFRTNILNMGVDYATSKIAPLVDSSAGKVLNPEEANQIFETSKPFTEKVTYIDAAIRKQRELELMEQEAIIRESDIAAPLLGKFAGGMADPLTMLGTGLAAAGLNSLSKGLISAGISTRVASAINSAATGGRLSTNISRELLENAAVAATLDIPLGEATENIYGEQMGFKEHVFNIAVGTAAGTLFRHLGAKFQKTSNFDSEFAGRVFSDELDSALSTGRAPDFDKALDNAKYEIAKFSHNPDHIAQAYKIVGDFDENAGTFFSSHRSNVIDGIEGTEIQLGGFYGKGLHLVANPALAQAKTFHVKDGEILKFNLAELNLLDIDQAPDLTTPQMKKFTEALTKDLTPQQVREVLKSNDLKTMLKKIDRLDKESPEIGLQERINSVFKNEGFDGFIYREDFFDQPGLIHQGSRDSGRASFLFDPRKSGREGAFVSNHVVTDDMKPKFDTSKPEIEMDPRKIEANRKATKLWEKDYKNDSMLYSGDVWRASYVETYDAKPDSFKLVDPEEIVTETDTLVKEVEDLLRQIEEGVGIDPNDKKFASAMKKVLDKRGRDPELYEQVVNAAIVCARRG